MSRVASTYGFYFGSSPTTNQSFPASLSNLSLSQSLHILLIPFGEFPWPCTKILIEFCRKFSLEFAKKIMGSEESSAQYIHLVQHLIEECLVFNMSKGECMEALSKHANINPVITSTVWKELEKENKGFFETYTKKREEKASEAETSQRLNNILLDASRKDHQ